MRERITTQQQLWLHDNTRKTWLVEPEPAAVLTGWTPVPAGAGYEVLERNTDIVQGSGYHLGTLPASANIGSAGNASYLGACPSSTVSSGNCRASYFRGYFFSKPAALLSFKIQIWRWAAASGSARVLTCLYSQECISQIADQPGWQNIPLTGVYITQPGDIVGISYTWSGTPVNFLAMETYTSEGWPWPAADCVVRSAAACVVRSAALATEPTYDWGTGSTEISNVLLPLEVWVEAPHVVQLGDSITEGGYTPGHSAGADPGKFWGFSWIGKCGINCAYDPAVTALYYIAQQYSWGYQNAGIFGNKIADARARFPTDVAAKKPKICIISLGANDALTGVPVEESLEDLQWIIDQCVANNIIPQVTAIFDFETSYSGYTTEQVSNADALRSGIEALVASMPDVVYTDSRSVVETAGYTIDGAHLIVGAHIAWGVDVVQKMMAVSAGNSWSTSWRGGLYSNRDFVSLAQDGTALTRQASLEACNAAAGSCYLSLGAQTMYVRGIADASPVTSLMLLNFRQFFAIGASGSALDECVFQPPDSPYPVNYARILEVAPGFSQRLPEALFGVATISIGSLRLMDGREEVGGTDSSMTQCIKNYIYFGQKCVCRVGGEDLPYSEYAEYWNGIMQSPVSADGICEIPIKDLQMRLEKKLPETTYTVAEFEHLEAASIGKTKPLGYGVLKNIPVTLIDYTGPKYGILGHRIAEITALRYKGIECKSSNLTQENLTDATFVLYPWADGVLTVDCIAWTDGTTTPQHYGTISVALLRQALVDAHIDLDSFAAIDVARPYTCGLAISAPEKINELLLQLDETYLCFHATSRAGKVFARAFDFSGSPTIAASFVNGETCWNLREPLDYAKIYKSIKCGYSKNWCVQADTLTDPAQPTVRQDWSWAFKYTDWIENRVAKLYGCEDTLIVDSLLADAAGAVAMAELRSGLHMMPWLPISFDCLLRPFVLNLGDFIEVSRCRKAPEGLAYMVARLDEDPKTSVCSVTALAPAAGYIG